MVNITGGQNMSEIVFILGAGASKEAGAPVMADFLDKADELRREGNLGDYKEDFDCVFNAISALQVVHSKADLDLDNIESVFAAFEMGKLINRLGEMKGDTIDKLLFSIKRLIYITLEKTTLFPVKNTQVYPNDSYDKFVKLLLKLGSDGKLNRTSIITFNYDLSLDYALYFNRIPAYYGINEEQKPGYMQLLKLHGSLNWVRCPKCEEIIPWNLEDYFKKFSWNRALLIDIPSVMLCVASHLEHFDNEHCKGEKIIPEPVIVFPTWNKIEHQHGIAKVWSRAALELSNAENIFISGYSLPESDLFFRYLFALGSVGPNKIKRFWVFDPDKENVEPRFRKLIGPGTTARFRFEQKNFGQAFEYLIHDLITSTE
jgi:hypothetical protein